MAITIAQINTAIKNTLDNMASLAASQDYNELSEGIVDWPMLQVYWQSTDGDDRSGIQQTTFRGGVRRKHFVFHADVFAAQRAHLDQDMTAVLTAAEELTTLLEAQDTLPYFGLAGIRAYRWTVTRVNIVDGDSTFPGVRGVIELWVF